MEFYQLEYLCAVAERGGYNQAARHLYRVPSAVKRGVALLEDEIGVLLLQRDGRAVRLTEEGQEFVRWARAATRKQALAIRSISLDTRGGATYIFGRTKRSISEIPGMLFF